ncbi:MAG: HupE/UreJ family protein [Burkholderiales bacterium]
MRALIVFLAIALVPGLAWAHPFHTGDGFAAGWVHPFTGLDHLLAMVAVGLWAAQIGGRARWTVPLAFVTAMLLGAAASVAGLQVPLVEPMVAASVVVLGLLITLHRRTSVGAGAAICAVFAVFHGLAHASELPPATSALAYFAGFALATALLHATGVLTGVWMGRLHGARWIGAPIALAGCALLGGALLG